MTQPSAALSDQEKVQVRIDAALLEYYQRVDRGEAVDREAFYAGRPEIAEQLRDCLEAADLLESIAAAVSNPSTMGGSAGGSSLTRFARAHTGHSSIKLSTQKVSTEGFVKLLRKSGLVTRAQMKQVLYETEQELSKVPKHARVLAERFVKAGMLTSWQQSRLLEGKESGYFVGGYKLLAHIGTGGMGSVYRAEHVHLRRLAAVKILASSRADRASYLERFHREARLIASLNHPNIVRAFDVDNDGPLHFLAMEYVDGINLQHLVLDVGFLSFRQAADYTLQTATGLDYAHRQGIIHRDVKPSNLLVDRDGVVKILDMGLAFLDDHGERSLTIEYDEKVLGTADYMAPEQAVDSHQVDHRADIYSLGCTMYFLLTGHPPFAQGPVAKRLLEHQTAEPEDIRGVRPDTPVELINICRKMMAKKPEDRYVTADEICEELERFLAEWAGQEAIVVAPDILPELSETDELAFFLAERFEGGASWTTTDDPLLDAPQRRWWHNPTLWATLATGLAAVLLLSWLMQGPATPEPTPEELVRAERMKLRSVDPFGIPQFDILDRAVISGGDLGYDITSTGNGMVLNQLPEPVAKTATFRFQMRAAPQRSRNGFLAFGSGPTEEETIKCGMFFSNQLIIYEGKWPSKSTERLRVTLPKGKTYNVLVNINLPKRKVTLKVNGEKLVKEIELPLKEIHYYGYSSIGSRTEYSEIEITQK